MQTLCPGSHNPGCPVQVEHMLLLEIAISLFHRNYIKCADILKTYRETRLGCLLYSHEGPYLMNDNE